MPKYRYGVSFTILDVIESDHPLSYDEIVDEAAMNKSLDPDDCNDIVVNTLDGTPPVEDPFAVRTIR